MAKTFTKLTRPAMRKLLSGQTLVEHGITFERTSNGDGVFTVGIMVHGQRIHRVVGRESDGTTRTQAEEFIEKVRSDAKNDRLALPKGRKVALSFREAARRYLERLEEGGGKDLKMKRQRLELHLLPFFGDMPLNKVSGFDIERYKHQRCKEPVQVRLRSKSGPKYSEKGTLAKPGTVNRELAVLSHLFNKAIEWGWIERRPAKINRFSEGNGRITYLTAEQVIRLVELTKADRNPNVYPFTVIAVETSMRLMEVLSMRRENVDLERRRIFIPVAKGGAREQPITEHLAVFLAEHIAALPEEVPWLFPSEKAAGGHTVDIRKAYQRAVKAAGLDPKAIVPHTLRHTAISHLVQLGVDLPTVKRISGHKTLAMVERYAHQNGTHIQAAMDKLQGRLNLAS